MALDPETDVLDLKVEKFTPGGHTYWVETKEYPGYWQAFCYRPTVEKRRVGKRCENAAGQGTDHLGTGACKFHGGNTYLVKEVADVLGVSVEKSPKYVRDVVQNDAVMKGIKARVDAYMLVDNGALLDLTKELAISRALMETLMERLDNMLADEESPLKNVLELAKVMNMTIAGVGRTADSISKIQQRNTLTSAHIVYLRTVFADLLLKYIEDPDMREQALLTLSSRIGGTDQPTGSKLVIMQ